MPIVNSLWGPMQASHIQTTATNETWEFTWKPPPRIGRYELLRADEDWLTNPPKSPAELLTPGPGRSRMG